MKRSIICAISIIFFFGFNSSVVHAQDEFIVPSIEKIFKDARQAIREGDKVYGCIVRINYGEMNPITEKIKIDSVEIGTTRRFIKLSLWEDFYKSEDKSPKLNDCLVFSIEHFVFLPEMRAEGWGHANIFRGKYTIIEVDENVPGPVFKETLTVDQYFEDGLRYGTRVIVLEGKVETIEITDQGVNIGLISSNREEILTTFMDSRWREDQNIIQRLRSLTVGDVIKLKGKFEVESGISFLLFGILDIVKN